MNAALCMARLDRYGVVEGAHAADLVLVDASPLEEIRNIEKVRAVVLRGRYLARRDLDAMLADVRQGVGRGAQKANVLEPARAQ